MNSKNISNPIVIHTHLIQKFMKEGKSFSNLLALYTFYIYHAQLQKTNQPLATDEFVRKGLNWALDRVKKTKRLLKKLGVIEVVQHKKYYYVHLFFIYTKKKIEKLLGKEIKDEPKVEKPKVEKSLFEKELIANNIDSKKIDMIKNSFLAIKGHKKYNFNGVIFAKWIIYCEKNNIGYNKNNIKHWIDKLNNRTSIEQREAVRKAIYKGWRDIYLQDKKSSAYNHLLGKSIFKDDRLCSDLIDIDKVDDKFIYQFGNMKVTTKENPIDLFNGYEYIPQNSINLNVKNKIMGMIKRF